MKTSSIFILLFLFCYGCRKESAPDQILRDRIACNVMQVRKGQMSQKKNNELSCLIFSRMNDAGRKLYFEKWAKELFSTTIQNLESDQPRRCVAYVYNIVDREIANKLRSITGAEELRFDLKLDMIEWLRKRLEELGAFYLSKWGDFDVCPHLYDQNRIRWHECYISLYHYYNESIYRLEGGSDYEDLRELKPEIRQKIVKEIERRLGRKMRSPESAREYYRQGVKSEGLRKVIRNLFPWPA